MLDPNWQATVVAQYGSKVAANPLTSYHNPEASIHPAHSECRTRQAHSALRYRPRRRYL